MRLIDKIKAWINVLSFLLIVDGVLRILAFVVYPISYLLRNPLTWAHSKPIIKWITFPLWIFNDDQGDLYGNEQECWKNINVYPTNFVNKFICAYYWNAVRNPVWNIYEIFRLEGERSDIYHQISANYAYYKESDGTITPESKWVNHGPYLRMNRAKFFYVDEWNSKSISSNEGDFLDLKESLFGMSLVYFKQNNKWWVLFSWCEIVKNVGNLVKIREFNIGAASRVLIRNKYQKAFIY